MRNGRRLVWACAFVASCAIAATMALFILPQRSDKMMPQALAASAFPLGVLGDSNSHSYHDSVWFPDQGPARGGKYHATTFQWTEILAKLRGNQVDLGLWGDWGTRGSVAMLREWFGLKARAPRKIDYRNNLAWSGAGCDDLMRGNWRQAPRLVALMDDDPDAWRKGIVIISIGMASFGNADHLERFAKNPLDTVETSVMADCVDQIRAAMNLIRSKHAQVRFALVGIFDDSNDPDNFARWQSAAELSNISAGLNVFDLALRKIADGDPRIAFFDNRAWFKEHWGVRAPTGEPAYREVSIGNNFKVSNIRGDDPHNTVLLDGHAGSVWNGLWTQSMVELMNAHFGTDIPPISDAEIVRIIDANGALGIGSEPSK